MTDQCEKEVFKYAQIVRFTIDHPGLGPTSHVGYVHTERDEGLRPRIRVAYNMHGKQRTRYLKRERIQVVDVGTDAYIQRASRVYGIHPKDVTIAHREIIKIQCFAVAYGGGRIAHNET